MSPEISERAFEDAIECALLRYGPDQHTADTTEARQVQPTYDDGLVPGGYHKRQAEDYDRSLCLLSKDVIDFILATSRRSGRNSGSTTART